MNNFDHKLFTLFILSGCFNFSAFAQAPPLRPGVTAMPTLSGWMDFHIKVYNHKLEPAKNQRIFLELRESKKIKRELPEQVPSIYSVLTDAQGVAHFEHIRGVPGFLYVAFSETLSGKIIETKNLPFLPPSQHVIKLVENTTLLDKLVISHLRINVDFHQNAMRVFQAFEFRNRGAQTIDAAEGIVLPMPDVKSTFIRAIHNGAEVKTVQFEEQEKKFVKWIGKIEPDHMLKKKAAPLTLNVNYGVDEANKIFDYALKLPFDVEQITLSVPRFTKRVDSAENVLNISDLKSFTRSETSSQGLAMSTFYSENLKVGTLLTWQISNLPTPPLALRWATVALTLLLICVIFMMGLLGRKSSFQKIDVESTDRNFLISELARLETAFEAGEIPEDEFEKIALLVRSKLVVLHEAA
jgi:hypothetical protein